VKVYNTDLNRTDLKGALCSSDSNISGSFRLKTSDMSIILPVQIFENGSCSGLSFYISGKDEEFNRTDLIYSTFVMSVRTEQLGSHGMDFHEL